jgi:KDO2-lipid IV(A) lauroyltransferase
MIESLKIFSISEKAIHTRMVCKNPEVVNRYFNQGRSIILAGGHYNNWELFAVAIDYAVKHQTIGIYKPMTNPFFDKKMRETRSKYGLRMISTKAVRQVFEQEKENLTMTIFGVDQSPPLTSNSYWMKFLNQDTGVLFGSERYAKDFNYPVVFARINKRRRGYYSFEFVDICEFPQQAAFGEITEKVTKMLEQDIIHAPQYWLWSHKRWKHKRPHGHVNAPVKSII